MKPGLSRGLHGYGADERRKIYCRRLKCTRYVRLCIQRIIEAFITRGIQQVERATTLVEITGRSLSWPQLLEQRTLK